jgi:hypothetical protein
VYFGFFDTLMVSHPGSRSQAEARPRLTLHLSPPRHPLWLTLCPCSCRGDIVCRTGTCTLAPRMSSSAQRPPSCAPRPRPSPLATPRTPSTPCVVACRCSPRSPRYGSRSGSGILVTCHDVRVTRTLGASCRWGL